MVAVVIGALASRKSPPRHRVLGFRSTYALRSPSFGVRNPIGFPPK
jgi:hypothetical protein